MKKYLVQNGELIPSVLAYCRHENGHKVVRESLASK